MTKFMVLYRAPTAAVERMSEASPEEMQEGMKAWMAWGEKCGDALVDFGTPLGSGQNVTTAGASASETGLAGYSVLQAEGMDAALALLEDHPHLGWAEGCSIEVYESLPPPGM